MNGELQQRSSAACTPDCSHGSPATHMLRAAHDRIDLWITSCGNIEESLIDQYRYVMSGDEQHKAARFRFECDRRRYIVTRALVRTVLCRYVPRAPTALRFTTNAYGRPEIANEGEVERSLSFNVSHSSDRILLGVTRENALGVDIEAVAPARVALDVAHRCFSARELAALMALPPASQVQRFFEYWTLKESYVKAVGMGLSLPLDSFSFDLCERRGIRFSSSASEQVASWRFWDFRPITGFIAAVCVRSNTPIQQVLSFRSVVPLRGERPLSCAIDRQSYVT